MRVGILGGVLSLLLSCAAWSSDTKAAILYPSGSTWVNGSAVVRSSALFPGDRVRTDANGIANITLPGSAVLVLSNSEVQFSGALLELTRGSLVISTTKGLSAGLGELKISPAEANAKFEVTESGENVLIVAREGNLTIKDGVTSTALPAGKNVTMADPRVQTRKRRRGAPLFSRNRGILLGAAGGSGAATAIFLRNGSSNCPVSPSSPGQTGCQ